MKIQLERQGEMVGKEIIPSGKMKQIQILQCFLKFICQTTHISVCEITNYIYLQG